MRQDEIVAQEQSALLTDVAVCGACGGPVRSELRSAGHVVYRCPGDGGPGHLLRSAPPVDGWVRLLVLEHLDRAITADPPAEPEPPDLAALRAHGAGLRTRLGRLTRPVGPGEPAATAIELTSPLTHELPTSLTGAGPLEVAWDRLGTERQRAVLRRLAERIALHPVLPGRPAGDPDVLRTTVVVTWIRR